MEPFGAVDKTGLAGTHGGAPLANFVQVSSLHGWICFTREAGKKLFHQQGASTARQAESFLCDHCDGASHIPKIALKGHKIKVPVG